LTLSCRRALPHQAPGRWCSLQNQAPDGSVHGSTICAPECCTSPSSRQAPAEQWQSPPTQSSEKDLPCFVQGRDPAGIALNVPARVYTDR
jgi:hypothetical protein